jgi:hypothetical protein
MAVDRVIEKVGEMERAMAHGLAEIVAEIIAAEVIEAAAIEVGAIVVDGAADGTIDGRFVMNNGHRLGPKNAVRRKPTIISRSLKRPRKSLRSIVSTWK